MDRAEHFHITTSPLNPRVGFERQGTENWKEWDRYLTIDGKRAYHMGNLCETCQFLFSKMDYANRTFSAAEVSSKLNDSQNILKLDFLSFVSELLPPDDYFVCHIRLRPQLVYPGDKLDYFSKECTELFGVDGYYGVPHNPKTPYYRDTGKTLSEGKLLINFIIPLHQPGTLDLKQVEHYAEKITQDDIPTALAISILDIEAPAIIKRQPQPDIGEHWCLAHYLLDGHHKISAAARSGRECGLLCFISRKESFGGNDAMYTLSESLTFQN